VLYREASIVYGGECCIGRECCIWRGVLYTEGSVV